MAKHLIDLNNTDFVNTFNTMTMTTPPTQSNRGFFRFVDKNPLFADNSQEAVYEYLISSRKHKLAYKTQIDESFETPPTPPLTNDTLKE